MFESIFGSMFGSGQSAVSSQQITQLYAFHATFRYATVEFLDGDVKSDDALGTQIQTRSIELYNLIRRTYIIDEYDYWGVDGKNREAAKKKVDSPTSNTLDACFALINNKKEEFDRLVKEGPTPRELAVHEKNKQRNIDDRNKHLKVVANCEHFFGGGFYQRTDCSKCGIKKEDVNDKSKSETDEKTETEK